MTMARTCLNWLVVDRSSSYRMFYYILTAAHVWEEVLKSAAKLGITLIENVDHRCLIDIAAIVPTMLKPDSGWNERGPDLALLRVPSEYVGGIKVFQVFEHLEVPPKPSGVNCLEYWMMIGTPQELGTFTPNHAQVQINGTQVELGYQQHDKHDYYDSMMAIGVQKSFGGMSGGGLWRI